MFSSLLSVSKSLQTKRILIVPYTNSRRMRRQYTKKGERTVASVRAQSSKFHTWIRTANESSQSVSQPYRWANANENANGCSLQMIENVSVSPYPFVHMTHVRTICVRCTHYEHKNKYLTISFTKISLECIKYVCECDFNSFNSTWFLRLPSSSVFLLYSIFFISFASVPGYRHALFDS